METYQLKRIIIIILALVNLSLLGLLGRSVLQQRSIEQQLLLQLKDLYLSSGITLTPEQLPQSEGRGTAVVQPSEEDEYTFAKVFLGEASAQESGSAIQYSSERGTLRFRRNSAFELTMKQEVLTEEDCLSLLEPFGYTPIAVRLSDSSVLHLIQSVSGAPIAGSTVILHFSGGYLTAADGYYIAAVETADKSGCCSAADALSSFLRYTQESGEACSSVTSIAPAWQLSAETLFQSSLLPAWVIETERGIYYVNQTGDEIRTFAPELS